MSVIGNAVILLWICMVLANLSSKKKISKSELAMSIFVIILLHIILLF